LLNNKPFSFLTEPNMQRTAFLSLALTGVAFANDNGLALTPPLGWRSWNLYGSKVNQTLIENIMTGMTKKHNGVSLCDLGFCDVGLDDNWQACGSKSAAPGMNYHDSDGNPLVNTETFPDFKAMTDHAHSLNLTSGWYGNNCICHDKCTSPDECSKQIQGDVNALIKYNFDSWKLDGCGGETDLVEFNKNLLAAGKKVMVENCHWGRVKPATPDPSKPPAEGCPWNFYRSSGDVRASYASVLGNLATVMPLHKKNLSYPGCWAYPDMLQVGCQHGPGGSRDPGLSIEETRTHFGSWSIVSSPLTLSHDVNNETVTDQIWDIISNTEVLSINQAYVGDSGGEFASSKIMLEFTDDFIEASNGLEPRISSPSWQLLYKPVDNNKVAVLLMNSDSDTQNVTVQFSDVPRLDCSTCNVRDVWAQQDLGSFSGKYTIAVSSHDAAFVMISA
jgi:alpha-galactosidase